MAWQYAYVLVGRVEESAAIASCLAGDEPVLITGEAGIGKSALVDAALTADGRLAVRSGALATLRHLPGFAIGQALGKRLRSDDPADAAARLERLVGPEVLVLEDLHWADELTLAVAEIVSDRVATVVTVRTGDPAAGAVIDRLVEAGFAHVQVEPLPATDAAAVARAVAPGMAAAALERVLGAAGGNPFLIEQLAAEKTTGSHALARSITVRLAELPAEAADDLAAVCLADRPLPLEAVPTSDLLRDAALVMASADTVTARHGLLREAVLAGLDDDHRRALHRRLADLIDDDGWRATHLVGAGLTAEAFPYARAAAQAAALPGERGHWLAVAASCAEGDEAERLLLEAALALGPVHPARAQALIGELETRGVVDPIRAATVATQRAIARLRASGDLTTGLAEYEAATAHLLGSGTHDEVKALAEASGIASLIDIADGLRRAEGALARAEHLGLRSAVAAFAVGRSRLLAGADGAAEKLEQAAAWAAADDDVTLEVAIADVIAVSSQVYGRLGDGLRRLESTVARAEARGLRGSATTLRGTAVTLRAAMGDFEGAALSGMDLLDSCFDPRTRLAVQEDVARALAVLGRSREAAAVIDGDIASDDMHYGTRCATWMLLHWHAGDMVSAAAVRAESNRNDAPSLSAPNPDIVAMIDATLGVDPTGDAAASGFALDQVTNEIDALRAFVRDPAMAVELLLSASDAWRPIVFESHLRCLWFAGEAARRSGRSDAEALLRRLEEAAGAVGATAFVSRARESLRSAGISSGPALAPPTRSLLSPRETEVLRLVGNGDSNLDIARRLRVSRRTVESQVSSAMRKLGAGSRIEAASLASGT